MTNAWQQTVKRVAAKNPGKSLTYILPLAKLEYRKMGNTAKTVKKSSGKKNRRQSNSRKY